MRRVQVGSIIFCLFVWSYALNAFDQLLMNNGDIISGRFLGKTDSLIYFESQYFGTLKVSIADAKVKYDPSTPEVAVNEVDSGKQPEAPLLVDSKQPVNLEPTLPVAPLLTPKTESHPKAPLLVDIPEHDSTSGLSLLWESAERTLNRFVHDRVPDWFPQLPEDWKGDLKFGININEAVTTSTRYYGEFSVEGDKPKANYLFKSQFAYAKQEKKISENDWGVSGRYRYKLDERNEFFESLVTHDVDQLNEPQLRTTTSVGFGVKPFKRDDFSVDTVFGGALERLDRRDSDPEATFKLNINQNLKWKFNKNLTLKQSLRFYLTPDDSLDYNYRFESGLDALIVGAFNLGLSYRLDFDSTISDRDARQKSRIITTVGVKF